MFGQVVFTVGSQSYGWEDVGLAAVLWGDWATMEAEVREGLACLERAEGTDEDLDAEVSAAADEFRYARDLLSAEETEAWLNQWGLSVESWRDYLRRAVLRGRWTADLEGIVRASTVTVEDVAEVILVDGICGGHLARWSWKLAGRVAAYEAEGNENDRGHGAETEGVQALLAAFPATVTTEGWYGLPPATCRDKLALLARVEASLGRFQRRVLTPAAIHDAVNLHRLDWMRLHYRSLTFPDEQVAREAAWCVREDGEALGEVARDAKTTVAEERLYLDEVDPAARDVFQSAQAGELIGPVPIDGAFALYHVLHKVLPTPDDPGVRQRAEADVRRRAVEREINNRVRWHRRL